MKVQCAICSGLIQTIGQVGVWTLEVLDTLLVKISLNNLIIQTTSKWLLALTSSWCRGTQPLTTKMSPPFSQLPTIATDATTKQPSCTLIKIWNKTTSNMTLPPGKATKSRRRGFLIISSDPNKYYSLNAFDIIILHFLSLFPLILHCWLFLSCFT